MVYPHKQCGEEGSTASLQPQEMKNCHLKPSQTFTGAQLRASCQAVSLLGTATAPPTTAGLSRGWCGLHNITGGKLSSFQDTSYSTRCHWKAKKAITSSERLLPTYRLEILGHFYKWNTSHFNNATSIMCTYLVLSISYVYTVFYTISCILAYAALSLLIHIFIYSSSILI